MGVLTKIHVLVRSKLRSIFPPLGASFFIGINTTKGNTSEVVMANKKFYDLSDVNWLFEQLKMKSMAELAKEVGCHRGSVEWIVRTKFSEDMQKQVKYQRKRRHTVGDK
jgi:hypothetical protein